MAASFRAKARSPLPSHCHGRFPSARGRTVGQAALLATAPRQAGLLVAPTDANPRQGALAPFLAALVLLTAAASDAADARREHELPLMKGWTVKTAADRKALGEAFFKPDFDDSAWQTIEVKTVEDPYTARYVFYRKWVVVPAGWKGKRISVVFGGVDDDAVVWVNGRKVGSHKGWNTQFAIDVTNVVTCGEKSLVAVLADNSGGGGAGIWKPVSLALTDELARIEAERLAAARKQFQAIRHQIVFESQRGKHWDLILANADGSNPVNLTRTPDLDELYPHASPDGSKVCFVVDRGEGKDKVRSVHYMNLDGSGRTKVADHARQPCWSPDGKAIAYLGGEFQRFRYIDYATKGIFFYDLETKQIREHPNKKIHHLYNLCFAPDAKWLLATVHGGMGYKHAILAIEADGPKVFNLGIGGCRPDVSPDGKQVAWGPSDWALRCGDLDFSGPKPRVANQRDIVTSAKPMKVYHVDWSPDGKHIVFSRGPSGRTLGHAREIVGIPAKDWNIGVADAATINRWAPITTDGLSNKEPDWVPVEP